MDSRPLHPPLRWLRAATGALLRRCRLRASGASDCAPDINIAEWLREVGIRNFSFECFDINPEVLQRAKSAAEAKGVAEHFTFKTFDINRWQPAHDYRVILAIQSLHHVLELETLFGRIHAALHPDGLFMTDDMIGRNGHQRWPEALGLVQELWKELPDKYKYNHSLKRFEKEYEMRPVPLLARSR